MARIAALSLALLGAGGPAFAANPTDDARCQTAAATRGFAEDLPHSREALRDGKPLTVVALGSSSTSGSGASSAAYSYPSVFQAELARLLNGHDVKVINRGVGGNSALQMFHRMDDDVIDEAPVLVIWQTGVNDAIQDQGIDRFKRILRKGIVKLREAGMDVVLMDHQPVPRMDRYPAYMDYVAALREVAAETATPVYRRFDVLATLLKEGRLRDNELFSADALHLVDASYACVGLTLARTIAEKVSPRPLETVRR